MIELTPPRERVVLVAAPRKGSLDAQKVTEHLEELARLVDTAGADIVGTLTQHIAAVNSATLIGEGKVEELRDIMGYRVMSTPGVVIDGTVVHAGGVPSREKIEQWLAA